MHYYLTDGNEVFGPLAAFDVVQFVDSKNFSSEKWQLCDQSHQWKKITIEEVNELRHQAGQPGTRANPEPEGDGPAQDQRGHTPEGRPFVRDIEGSLQSLAKIRVIFQKVWERQMERIISTIKNEEPKAEHEINVKEYNSIKNELTKEILEFWRKEGTLNDWIADLTWGEPGEIGDYHFRLKGKTPDEKMTEVKENLKRTKIDDLEGCYCFMQGDKYLYIGQTTKNTLSTRLLQGHNGKAFWITADSIRILIPKHMKQAKRIERLLILAHSPEENILGGEKYSRADETLLVVEKELEELTQP